MVPLQKKPQRGRARKPAISARKLSDEELKLFLEVLDTIMSTVPAPKDARKRYLKDVENRLRNNGVAFLQQAKSFPTYGLKLLGNDLTGFPIDGLKPASGKVYPQLFAWYWSELERLSKLSKPKAADVQRAQRVLTVLSFAKMLKVSSVNQIKKSLIDFETRVSQPKSMNQPSGVPSKIDEEPPASGGSTAEQKSHVDFIGGPSLAQVLGFGTIIDSLPRYVDFDSISTKPSALKGEPLLPEWFRAQFIRITKDKDGKPVAYVPTFGFKPGPYGKVCVLTEAAGKLRLIVPYNSPFVHSTGLFARARTVLNSIPDDCSSDQSIGHSRARNFTKRNLVASDEYIVSADLSNFSDNTRSDAIRFGLEGLGLSGLDDYLFNLPITLPNGSIISPCRLLMGLKGCFELSSVLHHYACKIANIRSYALCGDDLAYIGNIERYEEVVSAFGWSVNRNKTVISKTVSQFCGEMYWLGHRISPRVPKLHSFYTNGKLRKAAVLFSVLRDTIVSLNPIYNRRVVRRICGPLIRLLKTKWKGIILPTLPAKLRGLGLKPSRPGTRLLSLLSSKATQRVALMSIGILNEEVPRNRWFKLPIEITPSAVQKELPDFPALLSRGAVQLRPAREPIAFKKDVSSLDLYQAFEWYYDNTRLDRTAFEKVS